MKRKGSRRAGDDKRQRILKSAIKVFSQKGFFNSKVSEVARQAGVADGTIYLYFRNKDDILISLFEEKMGEIVENIRRRLAEEKGALARLRAYIGGHMDLLNTESGLLEVLQVELRQSNKFLKDYIPVKFLEYLDVLSGILEEGKTEGVFRADLNTTLTRRAIFGAMDEISLLFALTRKKKYDPAASAAEIYRLFVQGLCVSNPLKEAIDARI